MRIRAVSGRSHGLNLVLAIVLIATFPVYSRAQASIGIYSNPDASCTMTTDGKTLLKVDVIVTSQAGVAAVRFAAPKPDCLAATWISDEVADGLVSIGNSQTGITIAFGICATGVQKVLTITYQLTGTTGSCCAFPIVAEDPVPGFVQYIDCSFLEQVATPLKAVINPDGSCPCSDLPDLPPTTPASPSPGDGAANQPIDSGLSWVSSDPEGLPVHFDVYLGTTPDPPLVADNIPATFFNSVPLDYSTTYYWKVVAFDPGDHSNESPLWTFTTRAAPPPPPLPSFPIPSDGAIGQARALNLTWSVDPGYVEPLTYDVYFGTDSNPPLLRPGDPEKLQSVSHLALDTVYYWRVVARGDAAAATSGPVWSFRTTTVNIPPTGPYYPSPPDNAINPIVSALQWQGGSDPDGGGPVTFDVHFGSDADPPLAASDLTVRSYPVGTLTPETTYHWRVVVKDQDGGSTSGVVWTFSHGTNLPPTVPTGPYPENGASLSTLDVTVGWQSSDPEGGALTFDVYFGTTTSPPLLTTVSLKQVHLPPLQANETYFWKVVAHDTAGNTSTGPLWSFSTTGYTPPVTPFNPNPSDGAVDVTYQPTLAWQSSDPDGGAMTYDVYLGTTITPPKVATVTPPQFRTDALQNGTTYHWMIVARDSQGQTTTGPLWTFTTQELVTPFNPNPSDGAIDVSRKANLTWQSGGSVSYDVYFGTTDPPPLVATRAQANFTPQTLEIGTAYYWQIVARDPIGQTKSGPLWSFVTSAINLPPAAPSNPVPADGETDLHSQVVLQWESSDPEGLGVTFDVYFGADAPQLVSSNQTEASFALPPLQPNTTYHWQIVAEDYDHNVVQGPTWSFDTAGQFPSIGLYSDEEGTLCTLADAGAGLRNVYVVFDAPATYTLIRLQALKPECFNATWVADSTPYSYLSFGNSQEGITIGFGMCVNPPVTALTITYLSNGNTPGCCPYPVLADPNAPFLLATDCNFAELPVTNYPVLGISSDGSCPPCERTGYLQLASAEDTCSAGLARPFTVDIKVSPGPSGVHDGGVDLEFDPSVLTFVSVERGALTQSWDTFTSSQTNGVITISGTADAGHDPGAQGTFARVTFESECCTWNAPLTLQLHRSTGDFADLRLLEGHVTCTYGPDGDVDDDGGVTVADAQCALESYLNAPSPPPGGCGGPSYAARADVDCSQNVTPADARCIFLHWLDGSCAFCNGASAAARVASIASRVSLRAVGEGAEIVIAVRADGLNAVGAIGFDLDYPPGLSFVRIESPHPDMFATIEARVREAGHLRVGAYAKRVSSVPGGDLLAVRFRVTDARDGAVTARNFVDDLAGAAETSLDLNTTPAIDRVVLHQNSPNPFNPATSIRFDLPQAATVRLMIFDVTGARVRTLIDGKKGPGTTQIEWNGTDESGRTVATGIYFCVLEVGGQRYQNKMVLLK